MPDGSPIWSDKETQQMLKKLDAQIEIPEIPDAQAIFDRAEHKSKKIVTLRVTRFVAAAAAVVLICISLPVLKAFTTKGLSTGFNAFAKSQSADFAVMDDSAYGNESVEGSPKENEASSEDGSVEYNGSFYAEKGEESVVSIEAALTAYFDEDSSTVENPATGGQQESDSDAFKTNSYREALNKKREIEVEINEDSVSFILYDVSGQSEILSALWIEGTLEDAQIVDGSYVLTVNKKITSEEFESGYYLPMIGSEETGTGYIDEGSIKVASEITNAMFTISVYVDIGTGKYEIYTALS